MLGKIRKNKGIRNINTKFLFFIGAALTFLISLNFVSAFSGLGDGTLSSPYNITNCTQLQEMNDSLTSYYQLVNNINCSNTINWNSGEGFEPVGSDLDLFNGVFNGNNYNITDLFINRSSTDYVGLFGYAYGNISDVGLINVNITGDYYTGSLAGNSSGSIINCYATGNVNGNQNVGGLAGQHEGSITNSYATGNVNGSYTVGGLVGSFSNGNIINSYATGNVSGDNYVGGLIGAQGNGTIDNSYATGNVSGGSDIGGLIGAQGDGTIDNSYATGNVNGSSFVGGFVGQSYGIISNSYATGNVNGSSFAGGLAGQHEGSITNSYATGNVNGSYTVGGLIGRQIFSSKNNTIDNSYATGNVNGSDTVGGLIGLQVGDISNSYATGDVSGSQFVGGLAGEHGGSITNSYSTGNVNGSDYVGGVVGFQGDGIINNSYSTGNVNGSQVVGGIEGYCLSCTIDNSYTTGNVSGNTDVGGLVGLMEEGTIINSYWYNRSQGLDCYDGGNTGCIAISDLSYFYNYENAPMNLTAGNGWDFTSIWDDVYNEINYPVLQWQEITIPDSTPPTYNSVSHNSTYANYPTLFAINITDETALDPNGQYIFSTDNSGTWINDTAVNFTETPFLAEVIKTLNSGVGTTVNYRYYFTDNAGNSKSTSIYSLITTEFPVYTPPSGGGGSSSNNYNLNREFYQYGESFSLRRSDRIGFTHNGGSHTFTLDSFNSKTAKITIRSDPITFYLDTGTLKLIDLDNDSTDDIKVLYDGVVDSEAQIFIQKIVKTTGDSIVYVNTGGIEDTENTNTETTTNYADSGESIETNTKHNRTNTWTIISLTLASMILILVVLGLIGKRGKKKKEYYLGFLDNR